MFDRLIRFFIENSKFNYTLCLLIVILGSLSYSLLPKERFPLLQLDRVIVGGSYSGASNTLLDTLAVSEIEDEIKSIEGIDNVISSIKNSAFSIIVELKSGSNRYAIAQKIRDAVEKAKQNLPSDMVTPSVNLMDRSQSVIRVALTTQKSAFESLYKSYESIKDSLLEIRGVASVDIDGDKELFINVRIDSKKIEQYGISPDKSIEALKSLSYIYPLGKVEDRNYHFYITTYNGKKDAKEIEDTILKIDGKQIYLKDIAVVEKRYRDDTKIASIDLNRVISFDIKKYEDANALVIAKDIKKFIEKFNQESRDLKLFYYLDDSRTIKERLNNVTSNILFGLVLVFLSIYLLINFKMAIVITVGVPTSFFIGFIVFYFMGYSINLTSLLALLIALGVLVDDAIIVSENIQRHIEMGYDSKTSAINGSKEVLMAVTMASFTTIFAFLPLLFISGITGLMIKMIPIGVAILVLASYLESFLFLPIHSMHTLKPTDKSRDWSRVIAIYQSILKISIRYKKSFLFIFFILVPLATYYSIKFSKFQMFPKVDTPTIYLSGKLNSNTTLDETNKIALELSKVLNDKRDELGIRTISTLSGFRVMPSGESENGENMLYITAELKDLEPQNIVDEYITPYFSFDYEAEPEPRKLDNTKIIKILNKSLESIKTKYKMEDLAIYEKKVGIKIDIEIGIIAENTEKIFYAIDKIESKLKHINGLTSISNNAFLGVDEVKLRINRFGESLGITEKALATSLANLYLSNKKSLSFDKEDLLDVVIEDIDKDNFKRLKESQITIDSKRVFLSDIVDFITVKTLSSVDKRDFKQMKSVLVNVDTKIITAREVLKSIEPILDELKKEGFKFQFFGEQERSDQLANDLKLATIVAIFLIFLSLLYMFNSFRYTLMIVSVIPFSILGVLIGHSIMGMNLTMPSLIGAFGLAGVVINDGIVMLDFLRKATTQSEVLENASKRFRPIILTSLTTLIGLSTLIFFVSGQGKILQPIAVSLGFGLAWGTILNLFYIPTLVSLYIKK